MQLSAAVVFLRCRSASCSNVLLVDKVHKASCRVYERLPTDSLRHQHIFPDVEREDSRPERRLLGAKKAQIIGSPGDSFKLGLNEGVL